MKEKTPFCIPVNPNLRVRAGSVLIFNRVAYRVNENNTACPIGIAGGGRKKKGCTFNCVFGTANFGGDPTPCGFPLTQQSLISGVIGSPYNFPIQASGGTAPYTFAIINGSTAGLTLNSNGTWSGSIVGANEQTFIFTVEATDARGCKQTQIFSLQVFGG